MQNAKDNINFEDNFLPDVDLFITSLYTTMYLKFMSDFTLETADLYGIVSKEAPTNTINIVKTKIHNIVSAL